MDPEFRGALKTLEGERARARKEITGFRRDTGTDSDSVADTGAAAVADADRIRLGHEKKIADTKRIANSNGLTQIEHAR